MEQKDLQTLAAKGISQQQANDQLKRFATGFPFLEIIDSATAGHGIMRLTEEQQAAAEQRWTMFLADGGEACKFVPASGAASRMFKALFNFVDSGKMTPEIQQVIDNIDKFAFYTSLNAVCVNSYGKSVADLKAEGKYKEIIGGIILGSGLNYGQLPKGLLMFHNYPAGARTPLEEQIAEGAATAAAPGGTLHLHFTVSPAHRALFEQKLAQTVPAAEAKYGIKIDVSLSEQKASTDTLAANPDGTPFRDDSGNLLFRPGGHGALIENLNDIDAAVVFIKNIDNVVPDSHRTSTVKWKKILAGEMILIHDTIAQYIKELRSGNCPIDRQREMIAFLHDTLQVRDPRMKALNDADLEGFLLVKLNRPLRVCGMVKNEGEPGGGPFIAVNPDGSSSPQILESHQIAPEFKDLMAKATHFNPVDLVCYLKDADGKPFDLPRYVDQATGFISQKSAHGRELQALELPGLWNGAMSDWNTVFVEVPASTFNPVKTVNDLLRPAHQ
ncbi:MAG: DUF4301 family protein [Bacteroides sp.]|nr:DUF4301 family protein [Bacteroides sp.]MCM1379718.1 DUF4301 family protein [Bacteroides sp.]MCM1446073.1 DUF4301 family protein [Prevotella sp.]